MSSDQYVLAFDFDDIIQSVADVQESYELLTEEIRNAASGSSDLVDKVGNKLDSASSKLNSSLQSMDVFYTNLSSKFVGLVSTFKDLDNYSKSISDNLKGLNDVNLAGFRAAPDATAAQRIEAVSSNSFFSMSMEANAEDPESAKQALGIANRAVEAARKAVEESQKATTMAGKATASIKKALVGEAGAAGAAIGGIARKTMGSVGLKSMGGAGFLSGLFSLIFLGVEWKQRKLAERGEMENAAEAGGGLFKKEVQKGIGWLAAFGEEAQFQFGISKDEIQKVVKQVSNLGIEIDSKLTGNSTNFKNVNNNAITMALAVDKHLNIATGSTMENAIKLVQDYGYSLKDAVTHMKDLALAAKGSGMDINKFIGSVMEGSAALVQYQIDADDVAAVLVDIKRGYEAAGIDPKRAGSMAAETTKNLASGIMGVSQGRASKIAQAMGIGGAKGLEDSRVAFYALQRKFMDVKKEGKESEVNFMAKFLQTMDNLERARGFSEIERMEIYRREENFDYQGSRYIARDVHKLDTSAKGGGKLTADQIKEYEKTFTTEGATLTDLYKSTKKITEGLAQVGQGALKVLVGIYGILVTGIKTIAALLASLGIANPDDRETMMQKVSEMASKQIDHMGEGMSDMLQGSKKALGAAGDFLGKVMENWDNIMQWDPMKGIRSLSDLMSDGLLTLDSGVKLIDSKIDRVQGALWKALGNIAESLNMPESAQGAFKKSLDNYEKALKTHNTAFVGIDDVTRRQLESEKAFRQENDAPVSREYTVPGKSVVQSTNNYNKGVVD